LIGADDAAVLVSPLTPMARCLGRTGVTPIASITRALTFPADNADFTRALDCAAGPTGEIFPVVSTLRVRLCSRRSPHAPFQNPKHKD